jgi:hypothetical protein
LMPSVSTSIQSSRDGYLVYLTDALVFQLGVQTARH